MSYFLVDIYTPSRIIEKEVPADSLIVPTIKGEIQILPEHTHLITQLDTGVLTLKSRDKDKQYFVNKGICKILGKRVMILSKLSDRADEIDEQETKETYHSLINKLNAGHNMEDADLESLHQKIHETQVKLQLASHKK